MKPQLRDRITAALGWTTEQTRACNLQQLRDMLRVPHPKLAAELDLEIRGGAVVRQDPGDES